MKKLLVMAAVAVLALSLVACGSGKIKDGTYRAENKNASNGWTDFLEVTYKDGVIADVTFDAKNAKDGGLKSALPDENYPMTPKKSEWMPQLEANIKAAGTADKIEAIAGATGSSVSAKDLMKAVEESAKAGKTDTVIVDRVVKEGK